MKKEDVICKKTRRTFEEYDNIVLTTTLLLAIVVIIISCAYAIFTKTYSGSLPAILILFTSMVISLGIGVLYYNWTNSWICSTIVTRDGIYTSRKGMKDEYEKAYRKGYFIPWSAITRIKLKGEKDSEWQCTFVTLYGDKVEISSAMKYPRDCLTGLIEKINGLKDVELDIDPIFERK